MSPSHRPGSTPPASNEPAFQTRGTAAPANGALAGQLVRSPWLVLFAVSFSVLTITMDTGGMNVSLYVLGETFGVSTATVSWLALISFLVVSSTLMMFGRVSDILGSKRVFLAGFVVYVLGALPAGLAPSFPLLLVCRIVQSLGVAMLSANSQAILTENFPPERRGLAMGSNATVVGVGYFVGPIIAGLALNTLGWRYVFWLNVPIALAGVVVGSLILPRRAPVGGDVRRFDLAGAALFALTATSFLLGLNQSRTLGWTSPLVAGLVLAALPLCAAFVVIEKRAAEPMVDVRLFSSRLFGLSLLSAFLTFFGLSAQEVLVPLFVQRVLLLGPAVAGFANSTAYLFRALLSSPSGMVSDRRGPQWPAVLGGAMIALGLFGLSALGSSSGMEPIVGLLVIVGIGSGIYFSPNLHAIMAAVPPERRGMAAGATALRRNLGQAAGVAIAATLLPPVGVESATLVDGFQFAFFVAALAVALGTVASFVAGSQAILRPVAQRQ